MPHSYSVLWIHLIWSTKNRGPILTPGLRNELFQVMLEIAQDHEIYIDSVNGVEDHIHLLIRLRTHQSVADVVKTLKGNSWEYFRHHPEKYIAWQDGFAAFSVSPDNLKKVRSYIYNQETHHKDRSFSDELKDIKTSIKQQ